MIDLFGAALQELRAEHERLQRRRHLRTIPLASGPIMQATALEQLPAIITEATSAYLSDPQPKRALLLALPAGSGKTTAMVQLAEAVASQGKRVMYSAPRHDLFEDLMQMAQRPEWWYHWQPRHEGSDVKDATCRYAKQMERWLTRGYSAMALCSKPKVCGYQYVQNVCPYHKQSSNSAPIIFSQHQHIAVGHPLLETCQLVIGDEMPMGAFLHPWLIPAPYIVVQNCEIEVEKMLWTLRTLCDRTAPEGGWSGPALLDALGGVEYLRDMLEEHKRMPIDMDMLDPPLRDVNDVDRIDYLHLPVLISLLTQEVEAAAAGQSDWVRRVHCTTDGLKLLMRRSPKELPAHVIWCDATGDHRLYERLLKMPVEVVRPHVEMQGKVYQVYSSLNNIRSIRGSDDGQKIRELNLQVEFIRTSRSYRNLGIITYKGVKDALFADGHFGAERGTNRLVDRDALVVIGTPQPPHPAMLENAAMVFDERMRPFNATWTSRDIPFDGTGHAYPVSGFWDDPDLNLMLTQAREAELIQALHRVRPLRQVVDIWLLTNLPLPGIAPTLMSVQELFGAPEKVDPYRWLEILNWCTKRLDSHGIIISTDIRESFHVNLDTARKYMIAIARELKLQVTTAPAQGRGRPAMALIPGPECKELGQPD
jgi:hypothetical protein